VAMRTAVYLRQSLDKTGEGLAVDRQREDCLKLCAERGWTPNEYVDNDTSATKGVRPAYRRMLEDIKAGQIDAVVAWDLDRLHRQPMELEEFITLADEKRLALATIGGDADLSTDNGRLFARIKGAVARAEVERKSARQKRAMLQIAGSGRGWGRRSFGYRPDHDNPQLVPGEADAIRGAYTDLLAGVSLHRIAKRWNQQGLRTTQGANLWDSTSVGRVLRSPRNAGLRAYKGEIVGEGDWPAIVSRDIWEAAHYLLSDSTRQFTKDRARVQLLGGILKCAECGKGMGTGRRQNGPFIYKCKTIGCYKVSRKVDDLDEWVRALMIQRLSTAATWTRDTQQGRDETKVLMEEANVIRARMDSLAKDFAVGELTASQLRVANETMQHKLAEVEGQLQRQAKPLVLDGILGADDLAEAWDSLTLDRKRALIQTMCSDITVNVLGKGGKAFPVGTGIEVHWHQAEDA
jgi:DNA invertase Pin-like site-specific DNA recombinase